MKKNLFTLSIVMFLLIAFTDKTFAQRDAGGTSGGGSIPPQPCATSFARNNGDGTCNGQAEIRLYFMQAPLIAPTLLDVIYQGESLLTNPLPIEGNINDLSTKGYISYCLPVSNIPPAVKLTVVFKYEGTGQENCALEGTN